MFVISKVLEPSLLILGELVLWQKARVFALAKFFQLSQIILGEMILLLQKARAFALAKVFLPSLIILGEMTLLQKRKSVCPCQVFSAESINFG